MNPADPDRVIIIGGHYDSATYDEGCDPDTLAPGADDNASGTVVALEAARVLALRRDAAIHELAKMSERHIGTAEHSDVGSGEFELEFLPSLGAVRATMRGVTAAGALIFGGALVALILGGPESLGGGAPGLFGTVAASYAW